MPRDHGGVLLFAAERAAGFHLDDANLVLRKTAEHHQRFMNVVWTLQGAPDADSSFRVIGGYDAVVLDIQLLLRTCRIFAFDNVSGFFPDRIYLALFHQESFERVVSAPNDGGLLLALFQRMHRRQWLVFDGDGFDGLAKLVTVGVGQKQDGFFRVVHDFRGETGLVVEDQGDAILSGNISCGYDYKFVPENGRVVVDLLDFAARDCA